VIRAMPRRSGEREWPCIKCGVVDSESYMIALHVHFVEDEAEDTRAPSAWVHRRCWRTYRATVRGVEFVELLMGSEETAQDD
jgi:hypothetical protein